MDEIIKKIDERINDTFKKSLQCGHDGMTYNELIARINELKWVKTLILSEQLKESCTPERIEAINWLKNKKKCCTGCDYEKVETNVVPCCICSRLLDDEYTPKKPLTIGDKIRKSNESLAEFIQGLIHCEDCTMDLVDGKPLCNGGTAISCEYRILDYLTQPSTGTV